ncbi:MAG: DUF362 domain-containing protein [Planctomycetota bacterium]
MKAPRHSHGGCRRDFLKTTFLGGLACAASAPLSRMLRADEAATTAAAGRAARVALTAGDDRPDNVFRGLREFGQEIAASIGDRRVVIKPNNVNIEVQLASTHADCLEGILEFLKSIGKLKNTVIAESAASGPTVEGYSNFGYPAVAGRYGVPLIDLDTEETETIFVFDQTDMQPHAVRVSRMLADRKNFIISAAMFKTHDRVVATLSLKNIVFGAPIKDLGFRWGKGRSPGKTTQKPIAHGNGFYGINYNLFTLASRLRPDLSVLDGYAGMEGNGPAGGTPVDHRVAVVSPAWLSADRVAIELMGIDFAKVGYLNYCARAGMGEADLKQIEILGEPIERHVRQYRLHDKIQQQLVWMTLPQYS